MVPTCSSSHFRTVMLLAHFCETPVCELLILFQICQFKSTNLENTWPADVGPIIFDAHQAMIDDVSILEESVGSAPTTTHPNRPAPALALCTVVVVQHCTNEEQGSSVILKRQ